MKYDLVFEGGGAKGIVFVGACAEFFNRGHSFERLLGTSAGAIYRDAAGGRLHAERYWRHWSKKILMASRSLQASRDHLHPLTTKNSGRVRLYISSKARLHLNERCLFFGDREMKTKAAVKRCRFQ